MYDSTQDTLDHINRVRQLLLNCIYELQKRAVEHDNSKLYPPEKELFDIYTPQLKDLTYESPEYKESLSKLQVALDHHYAHNSHHPQFYSNGIDGMDLFDLIEMLMDWKAAGERNKNGDIKNSIFINKTRFGMSDQLAQIFVNTADRYLYEDKKEI